MSRGSRVRSPPGVPLGACSVMVIIDASQALDPGSIPGRRTQGNDFCHGDFFFFQLVLARLRPLSLGRLEKMFVEK